MKKAIFIKTFTVFVAILIVWCHNSSAQVIRNHGIHNSPNGECAALLTTSSMGGHLVLKIKSNISQKPVYIDEDISGMVWIEDATLLYTVSPIYGKPGIYIFNCLTANKSQIFKPKNINKGYPNGADYIELKSYISDKEIILFYYSNDVDRTDFMNFRGNKYLYQIGIDGTDFKRVADN